MIYKPVDHCDEHVVGERLKMPDWICDDRLLLGDAGRQQRQRRREWQRRQQLLLGVFLLEFLQKEDQFHPDRSEPTAVGAAEAAVA